MSGQSTCSHRGRRRRRFELADVVRDYGDGLRASRKLSGEQLVALRAIERCRTPALGGTREVCADCGSERSIWRSCRNRHCPKCQTLAKERWLEARVAESAQLVTLSIDPRHLSVTAEGWGLLSVQDRETLTRAGFDIVGRLGMDELRELLQDDAAPLDYLDAAGVL